MPEHRSAAASAVARIPHSAVAHSSGEHASEFRLYVLIVLMVLMWAANSVFGKLALREFPALLVVGLRMLISGVLMIPIYLRSVRISGDRGWRMNDVPLLLALGVLGIGLNQLLFVSGLSKTSVAHATIMVCLTPMLVLLLAAAKGLERISPRRVAGMGLALLGVGILQFAPAERKAGTLRGDLIVFAGSIAFAVFTVRSKAAAGRIGGVALNTFAYVGTGLALLPVTVWLSRDFDYRSVTAGAWASVTYMALFPSVIAYLIYFYALMRLPASRVSVFSYLQPLFATVMAIPALGEYPTRSLLIGGLLVLCGVFAAERAG